MDHRTVDVACVAASGSLACVHRARNVAHGQADLGHRYTIEPMGAGDDCAPGTVCGHGNSNL